MAACIIVVLLAYTVCVMSRQGDFAISRYYLMRGIETYKQHNGRWPRGYSDVGPYLDAPYTIESMNPRIEPIDDRNAWLRLDDWSMIFLTRLRYHVRLDEKGRSTYVKE